jgi:hypothetical protein
MTARAPERADTATRIIHGAIADYKSRHGLLGKNLSKQQRHEIGKARIGYAWAISARRIFNTWSRRP